MKTKIASAVILMICNFNGLLAQSQLTISRIMQDPASWIGTSPSGIYWSEDGKRIYFNWNPDRNPGDSLYYITPEDHQTVRVTPSERKRLPARSGDYDKERKRKVYIKNGDIFMYHITAGEETQITNTIDRIKAVKFSFDNKSLVFQMDENLYAWDTGTGYTKQLTNFKSGSDESESKLSEQDKWLEEDQIHLISVLAERKEKRELRSEINKKNEPERPIEIFTGKKRVSNIDISPDGKYITYSLFEKAEKTKQTDVPDYVTESGYTENLTARANVGAGSSSRELWIYNIEKDTVYKVATNILPGIKDFPDYYADYEKYKEAKPEVRKVDTGSPRWSDDGKNAIVTFFSKDNKDRWIALLDLSDGSTNVLDRQRDEAWIAGPGIGWFSREAIGWMPDNKRVWFQSEESGYAHLYTIDIHTGKKKSLTKGNFEIYNPRISENKQQWYFDANMEHPGVRNLYRMALNGGKPEKITGMNGRNDAVLSPDETMLTIRNSYANRPWELYLMKNEPGAEAVRITHSLTGAFSEYNWRVPEFITFKARDNAEVPARLYKPDDPESAGPAVIFVHGAGYLQNAHHWWSSYFREYMFHNFLVDNGYTVLDIDYRGSAGYGRDWRTAIYRHMGGWDLNDQVDGARYLVEMHDIDAGRIGIYGGSYGGFITLMALFTQPDVFAAGAALRAVTDWAHYNHGYTSNILNTPVQDSLAYVRSSPIYYAEGLAKPLLICHGMVDTNVHFQDVVRLSQRFIELGKKDWEIAVYPVEKHTFTEPSSWTDEYSRIFKLFETYLKPEN